MDKHNQLPDESKEQKRTEDLAHHQEQQILLSRSFEKYQTKFRDELNEIKKTMKDVWIVQHQAELEEKADNEQQLRNELSMDVQDNDAKHDDVTSRQMVYQENDNLKLQNENISEYMELRDFGSEVQARIGSYD